MARPASLSSLPFQISVLALLQALLLTNNVTLIAVTGLAGFALAPDKALATLPVTGYVVGAALASPFAAALMRRRGRRVGYTIGASIAIVGALAASHAVSIGSLWLLIAANLLTGVFNAFGASYRFAAADVADAHRPAWRSRAISLVLAGGIVGGVVGPELARHTITMLPAMYAGAYLALAGFAGASLLLAQLVRVNSAAAFAGSAPARPLGVILRQPACWIAILTAALTYGSMNLLMVATPIAMQLCSLPFADTALVLEWHVIGMFLPGLFTGSLIARFGVLWILATGCLLLFACIAVALSGIELPHFIAALLLLGVGWNFLYTGATTLLTRSYRPAEKNRIQGFNDMIVFGTLATSSLASGVLLERNGWALLNWLSLPVMVTIAAAIGLLYFRGRPPVTAG